jgi:hypothetical protein
MRSQVYLNTDGTGLWSQRQTRVLVTDMQVPEPDQDVPELRVYFDARTWNPDRDGLIYTDTQWLRELRNYFRVVQGFSGRAVDEIDYSEHGMQGANYVSLDVKSEFLREWNLHQQLHPSR